MTIRTDDLEAFATAARAGTLVAAARAHGVSKSVLTRRIARLEAALGGAVFLRSTRGLRVTALGRRVLRHAERVAREMDSLLADAQAATHEVAGTLRVAAPAVFSTTGLQRALTRFIERFPDVHLDLRLDDRYVDIAAQEIDLALRIGRVHNTAHYTVRRIGTLGHMVVAADGYLQHMPALACPPDLVQHRCLVHSGVALAHQWRFLVNGRWTNPRLGLVVRADVMSGIVEMARQGAGLAVLPATLARAEIAAGRLRAVLSDWPLPRRGVYCVSPHRRPWPATVQALGAEIAAAWQSLEATAAASQSAADTPRAVA